MVFFFLRGREYAQRQQHGSWRVERGSPNQILTHTIQRERERRVTHDPRGHVRSRPSRGTTSRSRVDYSPEKTRETKTKQQNTKKKGKRKKVSGRVPFTSSPPRYLSHPLSRILFPRMDRKRSNSLLPRSALVTQKMVIKEWVNRYHHHNHHPPRPFLRSLPTIAEHFVVRALAGFGVEDSELEVDGSFLLLQEQKALREREK